MYQVYCDNYLLYDDSLEGAEGYKIFAPKVEAELNKIAHFNFTIYNTHLSFNSLKRLKSIIQVFQDGYLLFRGRILNDVQGFYNEKEVECESEFAFLLDSIQRPYDFQGTPGELFSLFITNHNAQVDAEHQFIIGNITVAGENITRSISDYPNTWDSVQKELLEVYGGYLWVRHEADGVYIDYLAELNLLSPQSVEFGKNLLDLKRETKGEDIATAIIPLGAKDEGTGNRLTITDVNNGVDYVYNQEAVDAYGWIFKVQAWDDITDASVLLTKGTENLNEQIQMLYAIELTAADLAAVSDTTSFHLGTQVRVTTNPHSIDALFLVSKISVDLLNPAANKLTLGKTILTMTERAVEGQISTENRFVGISSDLEEKLNLGILETEQRLTAQITATSESITSTIMEEVYLKEDTDELINAVTNTISQTAEGVEVKFTEFSRDIEAVAAGADAQFEEINKYIRFVDGNIVLGEDGNTLTLRIENDRIAFLDSGLEVAYFSNNKLYVTNGEFINSLQLGKFVFKPRESGNLSFGTF